MVLTLFIFARADLRKLVHNLNMQKAVLKKNGLTVDGKIYAISFKGTCTCRSYNKYLLLHCACS